MGVGNSRGLETAIVRAKLTTLFTGSYRREGEKKEKTYRATMDQFGTVQIGEIVQSYSVSRDSFLGIYRFTVRWNGALIRPLPSLF